MDEIAFLEQFITIPSLSGSESIVATFLVEHMRQIGFDAWVDDVGNAIALVGEQGPLVALLGHIDTVGGNVPVRYEDGKLYGRGSVDAKGPFATFVCATTRAYQQGTLSCRIVLIGAVEEEIATSKGAYYVVDQYSPDYCVIGEPSDWQRITLGYKGRLLVHYYRRQPSAHSAGELRSAPEHLVDFWNDVQRYSMRHNAGRTRLFEQLTPSLQHVVSNSDGLHDWIEATIGLRLPEDVNPNVLAEELRAFVHEEEHAEAIVTLKFEGACPAFRTSRTNRLVNTFVQAIRSVGGTPGFIHKTGTSDMNVAGPAWQCPIVAYGPGDSRLDHTPDEHIILEDYRRAIDVVTTMLENIGT